MPIVVTFGLSDGGIDAKGESKLKDHEDWCDVSHLSHGMESARDIATGAAAGRRHYDVLKITKPIDSASVQLWRACCENHRFPEVKIHVLRTRETNRELFYEITLKKARVTSQRLIAATERTSDTMDEEIGLTFEAITMTYPSMNIEHEDAFRSQM